MINEEEFLKQQQSSLQGQQKISLSKSNPQSPRKHKDINRNSNNTGALKHQESPEFQKKVEIKLPKSEQSVSAKKSFDNVDAEDNESIIITKKHLETFEHKKSSILKRNSKFNLELSQKDDSVKILRNLEDGIMAEDDDGDDENKFTVEGDISGVTSVSEPSTRAQTHTPYHPDRSQDSEDDAVIDDCRRKSNPEDVTNDDQQKLDAEAVTVSSSDTSSVAAANTSEDASVDGSGDAPQEGAQMNGHLDTPPAIPGEEDKIHVSDNDDNESIHEPTDNEEQANSADGDLTPEEAEKDIPDEPAAGSAVTRDVSDDEDNVDKDKDTLEDNLSKKSSFSELDKDLALEDDLHVSDAEEEETPEPSKDLVLHDDEIAATSEDTQANITNNTITTTNNNNTTATDVLTLLEHSSGLEADPRPAPAAPPTFDWAVDQIVADVTTKAVISKEKDTNVMDFSAFNWKPNVDFFQFSGDGNTAGREKHENIFSFGKDTQPRPPVLKKKSAVSGREEGDRPRSKSLQRFKRTGVV